MASWRERREWRAEFKSLGVELTRDRMRRSIWHEEKKLQEARRWLHWQDHRHYYIVAVIGAVVGAVVTAIISLVASHFK
jgi:hypothetical protein